MVYMANDGTPFTPGTGPVLVDRADLFEILDLCDAVDRDAANTPLAMQAEAIRTRILDLLED